MLQNWRAITGPPLTEALSMGLIAQTGSAATLSASCTMQISLNLRLVVGNVLGKEMLQHKIRTCFKQAASCRIVSSMLVCQHQFPRVIEQRPGGTFWIRDVCQTCNTWIIRMSPAMWLLSVHRRRPTPIRHQTTLLALKQRPARLVSTQPAHACQVG